ncbi:hypothetical protein RN001_006323 [Aquatica leii]|uniref:HAT C-terminal dimerisation domain-containing protein n=1 Tax=Aquatica leii TaxID=1421715 RepID=A0AAN7SJR5_9COLE|nr:hypothetical protein RN001_006323 [Aquatica leii]
MIGKISGVATRIKKTYHPVLSWHCVNHRLELALYDALRSVIATNHIQSFLECIYSLYSQSNKNQQELREVASQVQILKVGKFFDIRWVASNYKTVNAVWNNFFALFAHFRRAAQDFLADCLCEVSNLSLGLQKRNVSLKKADEIIKRTIWVLESFKTDHGEKFSEALSAVKCKEFRGVTLSSSKIQEIKALQFLQSLIDNIKARVMSDKCDTILSDIQILDKTYWPDNPSIRYGEQQIRKLCSRFHLDTRKALNEMREYVDRKDIVHKDLEELSHLINTFPCSTSECKRGFSAMNLICSKLRSKLLIENISNLMMIKINGPPLEQFNPENYVES